MLDDFRERLNEAERLFAFRKEQLAVSNFTILYHMIRYSGIFYIVLLVLHFIANLYKIPLTDAVLLPVYLVFFKLTKRWKDLEVWDFGRIRLKTLVFYVCVFGGVSVIEANSVAEGRHAVIVPLLLSVFTVFYMDQFRFILLFEAVFVGEYLGILAMIHALTPGLAYSAVAAFVIACFVHWSVLGIYTQERRDNRLLEEKSSTDGLTGLLNKVTCEEEIRRALSRRAEGGACALIILDFDNFKQVNDKHGHLVGDKALRKFGDILRTNFRDTDILGRVGGDEFMVLARDPASEDMLVKVCNRILMELATTQFGEARGFTCSIGIARDVEGYSFEALYHVADDALYEAKARGKAQYVMWHTRKIVPPERRAIYIASPDQRRRDAIKKICGPGYIYFEGKTATQSLNTISLYGETHLESVYFDFEQPDMEESQIRKYMESRPLYRVLTVHDVQLELRKSHIDV